jgi:hypothetical protein
MKLLNIETPVTRIFIPQILLNVQDFYFHKVGYTNYDKLCCCCAKKSVRLIAKQLFRWKLAVRVD